MKLVAQWKTFPPSMRAFFAVYFSLPVLAWFGPANLVQVLNSASAMDTAAVIAAYYLFPWVICILLFKRSALVLPALFIQLGAMSFDAIARPYAGEELWGFRLIALLVVCGAGIIFTGRDVIFPLIATHHRGFRRAPRICANHPLRLLDHGQPIPVILENCSLTGMAIYGEFHQISNFLRSRYFDDPVYILLGSDHDTTPVRASIVAVRNDQTSIRIGLSVADYPTMSKFIRSLAGNRSDIATKFKFAWTSSYFQRIAIGTWAAAMLALIYLPPYHRYAVAEPHATPASVSLLTESSEKSRLIVEATGLDSDLGQIRIVIDDSAQSFLKSGRLTGNASIHNSRAVYVFDDLPTGEYAVRLFHDVNENGKLDTNLIGIPIEAYGFSNNARRRFGAPSFEEAKFRLSPEQTKISIEVKTHL